MKCSNCGDDIDETTMHGWRANLHSLGWSLYYCKVCSDLWGKSIWANKWKDKQLAAQQLKDRKRTI